MTPRQRHKRRIVAFLVKKARVRKAWERATAAAQRFGAAMAEAYKQAREKQA